jgi:DNA gyrase subunit A
MKAVQNDSDLMITSKAGIVIRMAIAEISVLGRATQGVRVIKLHEDDEIADVAVVVRDDEELVEAQVLPDENTPDTGGEEEE